MEIGDWLVAMELDVAAAAYVHEETLKREMEREQRDRDFWITAFGGQSNGDPEITIEGPVGEAQLGQR